jgi:superfamily II DNA or RNA helicase
VVNFGNRLDNLHIIKYNNAMTQGQGVLSLKFERGTLLLTAPNQGLIKKISQNIPVSYDPRVPAWRCDALYYTAIRHTVLQANCRLEDNVSKWREVKWPQPALPPLREEQKQAVKHWMNTKRGVIVMPTGTGKTEIALAIMQNLAVSTLIVAPVRDLMYQWHRRILRGLGYDAGIIGDNTYMVRPVSVITYDSACIHMEKLGRFFQLIVFDECHHLPGEMRREAALMCAAPFRMGLTATPERSDGRQTDLDWLIGPVVFHLPISKVKGNTLADYEIIRIPVHLSREEQDTYNTCSKCVREYMIRKNKEETSGTFQWQDLMAETGKDPEARAVQKAYYKMQSIQNRAEEKLRVLEDIFRLHLGERIIIFTGSNRMAREISCRFLVPCLLNHCKKKERLDILDGFRDGVYPALVANQVLDEGVDIPAAKVAVVVGGSASTRQAKQRLGRILRKSGSKQGILYEVVCEDTSEVQRSRDRRSSDAYQGTRHRRL